MEKCGITIGPQKKCGQNFKPKPIINSSPKKKMIKLAKTLKSYNCN